MNLNKYFILSIFALLLTLSACSSAKNTASNEMEGIELDLTINKQEFSQNDEIIAKVILTNHNDSPREIFVPIPVDTEEGISAVMVEKKDKMQWQLLSPENKQDISNIKGRSFYDYVLVEIGANETIEQEFVWNKELLNQESDEIIKADNGDYILSTFVILDEIKTQEEYYEPEKQSDF
ncbi:hypothetical protein NSQ43_11410 [Sporosarcina sp. FSL W8-0480]|uniref:hypothetical protein n=1 Tax=Sporosarcina sp. FSL W8-0480 TaxID=2954701 RepID=UPI0030DDC2C2